MFKPIFGCKSRIIMINYSFKTGQFFTFMMINYNSFVLISAPDNDCENGEHIFKYFIVPKVIKDDH